MTWPICSKATQHAPLLQAATQALLKHVLFYSDFAQTRNSEAVFARFLPALITCISEMSSPYTLENNVRDILSRLIIEDKTIQ